jgi:hypothetical protein
MKRYWIALNGTSCAMSSIPMRRPDVSPRPYQLIGFPTWEEARDAQRICLETSISEVEAFMQSLVPAVRSGQVMVIQHDDHEPPNPEFTAWMDTPLPPSAN